jgi:hypothetical protein
MAVNLAPFIRGGRPPVPVRPVAVGQNDAYLKVVPLKRDWTLNSQLAQTDRISRLTNSLTQPSGFSGEEFAGQSGPDIAFREGAPFMVFLFRGQPVIRVYDQSGTNVADKENDKVY